MAEDEDGAALARLVLPAEARRLRLAGWLSVASGLVWLPLAWLLAGILAGWITAPAQAAGPPGAAMVAVLALAGLRAGLALLAEDMADRTAGRMVSRLRHDLLAHVAGRAAAPGSGSDPAADAGAPRDAAPAETVGAGSAGRIVSLAGDQLALLHPWAMRYGPARLRAAVLPLAILVSATATAWAAGLILLIAGPAIPVFMALIGQAAGRASRDQLAGMGAMGALLADRAGALADIRLLGATDALIAGFAAAAGDLGRRTMRVLAIAFLSSAVLELFAALGIAMIAVFCGFSLLGEIGFGTWQGPLGVAQALWLLLIAPEFFQPLRDLAAAWHDRASAAAAAEALVAEQAPAPPLPRDPPFLPPRPGMLAGLTGVRHRGRDYPDLTLAPAEALAVTGPSGAGKTALLRLLAGLEHPAQGEVVRPPRTVLGWMPQQVHFLDASLERNLRLGRPGDPGPALAAAAAGHLPGHLPQGLATRLGERGAGLSGGEARRLTLARAIHGTPLLILADEPTADLDRATAAQVIAGLVAAHRAGAALVVATHDPELVRAIGREYRLDPRAAEPSDAALRPAAARATLATGAGDGPPPPRPSPASALPARPPGRVTRPASSGRPAGSPPALSPPSACAAPASGAPSSRSSLSKYPCDDRIWRPAASSGAVPPDPPRAGARPSPAPAASRHPVWRVWRAMAQDGRGITAGAGLAGLASLAGVGLLMLSGWFISAAALTGIAVAAGASAGMEVFRPAASVRALALLRTLARYGERMLGHDATLRAVAGLRVAVLGGLARLPWDELQRLRRGPLLARVVADTDRLDGLPLRLVQPALAGLAALAGTGLILGGLAGGQMALAICGCHLGAALAGAAWGLGRAARLGPLVSAAERAHRSLALDLVAARDDLLVHGLIDGQLARAEAAEARARTLARRLEGTGRAVQLVQEGGRIAALGVALVLGGQGVAAGRLGPGLAVLCVMAALALAEVTAPLRRAVTEWGRIRDAAARVAPLLAPKGKPSALSPCGDPPSLGSVPATARTRAISRRKGCRILARPRDATLRLAGPSPGYLDNEERKDGAPPAGAARPDGGGGCGTGAAGESAGRPGDAGSGAGSGGVVSPAGPHAQPPAGAQPGAPAAFPRPAPGTTASGRAAGRFPEALPLVLDGLELGAGQMLALSGPSGAGKSTLLHRIAGLIPPGAHRICLGGRPVGAWPEAELRMVLALLPQRSALIGGTLAENLALADPDAGEAQMRAVLEIVALDGLEGGLERRLGEGGAGLSGGEARRLALARTLLRRPRVLLLDEPTEGLDAPTARRVMAAIARLRRAQGFCVVAASHRPADLAGADFHFAIG